VRPRRAALLAQHDRRPRPARVELRRELGRELAWHPTHLLAAGKHGDRVRVVLVVRVAAELQRAARRDGVRGRDRIGVMPAGAGDTEDVEAAGRDLGGFATQVAPGLGIDELVPRDPDLPAVIGVPVPLLVAGGDLHRLNALNFGYGVRVPEPWSQT
jgi:hypothetical protein